MSEHADYVEAIIRLVARVAELEKRLAALEQVAVVKLTTISLDTPQWYVPKPMYPKEATVPCKWCPPMFT